MNTSKTKLFVGGSVLFILGIALGIMIQQRSAAAFGGTASDAKVAQADQALEKNDVPRAESLAFEAISLNPSSYLPYQVLGEVFSRRNEKLAAISAYSKALEKLAQPGGGSRILNLSSSMRQTEVQLLKQKIASLQTKP
jgi:Tfp pilus assembly protein PilF